MKVKFQLVKGMNIADSPPRLWITKRGAKTTLVRILHSMSKNNMNIPCTYASMLRLKFGLKDEEGKFNPKRQLRNPEGI